MSILSLIRRELANAFLHDARRAIFLFGAATAYLILFGILYYPGVVKEIPTVVCDEEHTAYSRLLIRQVDDDERLGLVRVVADEGEALDMLRQKEVYAAVIIPADFSHDILNGRSAKVLFMLNGANIITTNIATTAGNDIVNTFNTRFAARQAALRTSGDEQMLKKRISPVETTLRVLNNPTQSYMMFFMVGLAMAAMQQGIFLAVGAAVQGDFKDTEGLKGAPKAAVLVVKVAVYWLLSVLSFALVCVISYGRDSRPGIGHGPLDPCVGLFFCRRVPGPLRVVPFPQRIAVRPGVHHVHRAGLHLRRLYVAPGSHGPCDPGRRPGLSHGLDVQRRPRTLPVRPLGYAEP